MTNIYDILETCLQELENGADLDTVLFRYPEFAEELRPMLEASVQAKSIASPEPAADVIRRNRAKVLQYAAQVREEKTRPAFWLWSAPLRRTAVSLAVVTALFISGTGLVGASSNTLPGDNLYPVKRTWEGIRLWLTFDSVAREVLEVEHENERLEELNELFAEGRSEEVDFAGVVTSQDGGLWLVSNVPVAVSAQTRMDDAVAVGDAVRVRGVTQPDGSVLAERIDLLDAGMPLPEVEDDLVPEVEEETSGNGNEAQEDNSGPGSSTEAPEVEQTETAEPSSEFKPKDVSIHGEVDSIEGDIIIVNGIPMDISNAEIEGVPAEGVEVKVDGYYDANGIFIVTKIEFENGGSDSSSGDSGGDDNSNNDDNSNDADDDSNSNSNDDDNSGSGGDGDD